MHVKPRIIDLIKEMQKPQHLFTSTTKNSLFIRSSNMRTISSRFNRIDTEKLKIAFGRLRQGLCPVRPSLCPPERGEPEAGDMEGGDRARWLVPCWLLGQVRRPLRTSVGHRHVLPPQGRHRHLCREGLRQRGVSHLLPPSDDISVGALL
jgi:hypothetical protein